MTLAASLALVPESIDAIPATLARLNAWDARASHLVEAALVGVAQQLVNLLTAPAFTDADAAAQLLWRPRVPALAALASRLAPPVDEVATILGRLA